ncbi:ABC transporter ATP-binding protein [soil metagenome]
MSGADVSGDTVGGGDLGGHGLEGAGIRISAGGTLIVDGVDCTVPEGAFAALVGPNGAGKSTLLRALAGVDRPHQGRVSFDGWDLFALPRRQRALLAAFVEQDTAIESTLSVRSVVALGRLPHEGIWGADGSQIVPVAMEVAGIAALADRVFDTLSGGERQRVMLARALAQEPRLLLLDEPTNHLDIRAQLDVLTLLHDLEGVTVLAALHDLGLAASYSEHVIVLRAGRVVAAGPTRETLTPELIHEVYGVTATMLTNPVTGRPVIAFS